jgi:oligopeptide transport system permease protein
MTALPYQPSEAARALATPRPIPVWRQNLSLAARNPRIIIGGAVLLLIVFACVATLPFTLDPARKIYFDGQFANRPRLAPSLDDVALWFGTDTKGRSILARCLMGGVVSLAVGLAAAFISVTLGVSVGLVSGFRGGWIDSVLMRIVDILYGLPYLLLVILLKMALDRNAALGDGYWTDVVLMILAIALFLGTVLARSPDATAGEARDPKRLATKAVLIGIAIVLGVIAGFGTLPDVALSMGQRNIVVLFLAIGLVSWLTMARVIRGQVLSLRSQPYVEAARALGIRESRIFLRHILPNLVGPITVYTTLTIPQAILQESFLSFLGLGVLPPTASWGGLASENRLTALDLTHPQWWMLAFPCIMLALTLLSLNFLGDGLRDIVDPKREAAKL